MDDPLHSNNAYCCSSVFFKADRDQSGDGNGQTTPEKFLKE